MFREIIKSFFCAFRGIVLCATGERNFRIHLTAIFYVTVFSLLYSLERDKYILLLLIFTLVVFAELVNTAVETVVNLNIKHYDRQAKNAKDIAAGAVLIAAISAVIIAVLLFSDIEKLSEMTELLLHSPYISVPLVFSIPFAVLFIDGKFINRRKK